VQRSNDGLHFETIATVTAADCNLPFTFTDNNPLPSTNYYRIGINEADGTIKYSAIIVLHADNKNLYLSLQPNIISDITLHLQADAANAQALEFCIADMAGRVLLRKQLNVLAGTNQLSVNAGVLAKGIYVAYCSGKTGRSNVARFVKE
jgi:hypothetical protein